MKKLAEDNLLIQKENQNQLRELETQYISNKIELLPQYIEEQKEKICHEIIEYANSHKETIYDRNGNPLYERVKMNPLVISNYFFKSVCPISSQIPEYNAEKLGIVFDYYMYIIAEINDKFGNYPSSLTSFCKLAGITTSTLRNYKNSPDLHMRNLVEKIYDQIGDENITMSQMGIVKERSTIFKMKSQNEITEKVTPNVNINYTEIVDTTAAKARIDKYKSFIDSKSKGK